MSYRLANETEVYLAHHDLLNLGESAVARLAMRSCEQRSDEDGLEYRPIVVQDFSGWEKWGDAQILLIPPGVHRIPRAVFRAKRFFLGLHDAGKPTLLLDDAPLNTIYRSDDHEVQTQLHEQDTQGGTKFANLRLDASAHTVLQTCLVRNSEIFSDYFHRVECTSQVDVLDIAHLTFMHGHAWVLQAYGDKFYQSRSTGQQALESVQDNLFGAIDGVFRPLLKVGEKLDRMLGWK